VGYKRKTVLVILGVLLIALYMSQEHKVNGRFGFPLDDSWIHMQFAKNIGTGAGFSYNAGISVAGSTAPLWTFILAIPFISSLYPILFSKLAGVLFYLISLLFFIKISDFLLEDEGESFFTSAVFVLVPIFTWSSLSGMEIMLFTMLTLSGIAYHFQTRHSSSKKYLSTVLLSLAGFARPECFLLAPIVFLDDVILLLMKRKDIEKSEFISENMTRVFIWSFFIFLFLLFNYQFDGRIFPNTFYAKVSTAAPGSSFLHTLWLRVLYGLRKLFYTFTFWFYNTNILFFAAFFPGILGYLYNAVKKKDSGEGKSFLPVLLIFLYPFFMGAVSMGGTADTIGRYITHLSVFFSFISAYGIIFIWRGFADRRARLAFASVFVAFLLAQTLTFSLTYAGYVNNIEEMQVKIGEWVNKNTDNNALLALNDVGAIKYITGRQIIDTWGLVTSDILPYLKKYPYPAGMLQYILEKKPDYLIVFPSWYSVIPTLNDTFTPVFRVRLRENYVCGGKEMVVYKCRWDKTGEIKRYILQKQLSATASGV